MNLHERNASEQISDFNNFCNYKGLQQYTDNGTALHEEESTNRCLS